ncbi:MAG: hypothetical protein ABIL09_25500 [Gemmatimonadota bacterium]
MKRRILGIGVLLLLGGLQPAGAATDSATARQLGQLRAQTLAALALTPEQEGLLTNLRDHLQEELQRIRAAVLANEISPLQGRAQLSEAVKAQRQAREAVLTPEQRDLLAQARELARQIQLATPEERLHLLEPTDLVGALHLTPRQQRAWLELANRQREELGALRRRGEVPTFGDVRRLRQEHRRAFEAMLTPTQLDQLQRLRDQWWARQYGAAGDLPYGSDQPDAAPADPDARDGRGPRSE